MVLSSFLFKNMDSLFFFFLNTTYVKKEIHPNQGGVAVTVQSAALANRSAEEFKSLAINLKETNRAEK